ncbi:MULTISPECIES: RNA polymerase sigma factor [Empedobacter]|uniref:RNA polymerase sigma factor n=1 Tax=Empedobacter falsenii TaxID=343874 RepID=A0A427BK21_9FLAO|nr:MULTISPECIES: RNA polymerase sigma factor [Empedobacter]MDH0675014.1 RNA polymerase sigma factor [Empedobacter sp. GD03861]MDM1139324.1 RNA polymerase sigma factor [Empedobacter sp. R132-2]RRT89362.1 RNA polymerase sigma factor [Empedobacter falsenii]RRT89648.1 RNA polymerase sigma factor [Empedobacter falsenii]
MDQKILDHILDKDWEQAFKLLVKDYHQRVYWQIRRMVLIHEDADDIAQNVFIKIYQNLNSFKNESKLSTWIFRITYNETINFIHKNAKEQNVSFEDYSMNIADDLSTDEYFTGDEIELKLQKAIASLPEKQRVVFMMKYYDEMKYEQISEISGTSVGALKASYHHAVTKIKEFLEDED